MQKRIQEVLQGFQTRPIIGELLQSLLLFNSKRGAISAAGCSFFALISMVPLLLLIIRVLGWVLGNEMETLDQLIFGLSSLFPNIDTDLFERLKRLLEGPLYATKSITFFNLGLLLFSSLSLFNHIHSGLYLMTENRRYLTFKTRLQTLILIALIITFVGLSLSIPVILQGLIGLLSKNWVIELLWEYFPVSRDFLTWFASLKLHSGFFFKSQVFHGITFLLGFTLFYRWLFGWRQTSWRPPLFSASVFVFLLLLLKYFFWIYFSKARAGLVQNYGDFYTVIVGMIWLFLAMCFFFYSVCLCKILKDRKIEEDHRWA